MSNQQPTGYNFVNGKLVKEHECPICLMLIRDATELPCSHLMCRDCMVYYEEKELEKNEHADFRCSLCQEVYHRNEKKEVRSHDRIIRESLDVKCKNWKDGCDWVGNISDYQSHHINVCDFLPVECPNNGCKKQMQRRKVGGHQKTCEYRIVPCEHCQGEFPICWLKGHHETCPLYPVVCENSECKEFVKRKQLEDHCKNECQYQFISCIYSDVGCTIQLPRHAMETHQKDAIQHHSFLLLKSHVHLAQKNRELEAQLKKSNQTIEHLQETVMQQEESIDKQQAEITCLQNDVKKQEDLKVKEKLTNLEMFAQEAVDLFRMVMMLQFAEAFFLPLLSQKDYNKNEQVTNFKNHIEEIKSKETDCQFLQATVEAAEGYNEYFFSTDYGVRLLAITTGMKKYSPIYQIDDDDDNISYVKTDSYPCNSISFNVYKEELFEEELKKNKKWNRHSTVFASYYDYTESCYYITLKSNIKAKFQWSGDVKGVWLLHNNDESQNMKMNINDKTLIDWHGHEAFLCFIFQFVVKTE